MPDAKTGSVYYPCEESEVTQFSVFRAGTWPLTGAHPYRLFGLASVSKTYIAALVAELAAEGALSVDDPIEKWIPDLGRIDGAITIRQLLQHVSGLNRYQQKPEFLAAITAQPERIWTVAEIVQEFQGEPDCQPGRCAACGLREQYTPPQRTWCDSPRVSLRAV